MNSTKFVIAIVTAMLLSCSVVANAQYITPGQTSQDLNNMNMLLSYPYTDANGFFGGPSPQFSIPILFSNSGMPLFTQSVTNPLFPNGFPYGVGDVVSGDGSIPDIGSSGTATVPTTGDGGITSAPIPTSGGVTYVCTTVSQGGMTFQSCYPTN